MSRIIALAALLAVTLSLDVSAAGASSPVKDLAKRAVDRTANWVIDQYNVKAKQLGTPEDSSDPALWAIYVTAICEQRRDYKEINGPYVSDPVQILVGKVKDDGTVDGAKDAGLAAHLAAQALESTKNENYKPKIEALKKTAKTPAAAEFKTIEQLASIELKPDTLLATITTCRQLAKDGKKEVTVGDKTVKWAELITESLMKKEQKGGSYTGDLRTDALVLQLLNVCYKQL